MVVCPLCVTPDRGGIFGLRAREDPILHQRVGSRGGSEALAFVDYYDALEVQPKPQSIVSIVIIEISY